MKKLKSLLTFLMLLTCMHSVAEKKEIAVSNRPIHITGQGVSRTPIALADVLYVVYDDTASELELSCDSSEIAYTFIIYDKVCDDVRLGRLFIKWSIYNDEK